MRQEPLYRVPYRPGLGALGGNTTTIASGAASGAAAGSAVLPGLGTAVGALAGAIAGIFGGQSNPQIQIDKNNAINLFSQYQAIAGTVSGRSIGLENMDLIFRGACFEGHFPSWNNETELPDSLLSMPGSPYGQNDNCFAVLWQAASRGVPAPGTSGVNTGNNGVPVKDAKTFVDNYVWPSNSPDVDTDPWATNTDSVGKQIIYDCADAYLATQTSSSVPYIANAPPAASAATTPVSTAPVATTTPTTATAPAGVPIPTPLPPPPPTQQYSQAWSTLLFTQNGALVTPQGTFTQAGQNAFYWNGKQSTNLPTQADWTIGLVFNGANVYAYNRSGADYIWQGQWVQTDTAPAPTPALAQALAVYSQPMSTSGTAAASAAPTTAASSQPQAPPTPTVIDTTDGATVTAPGTALETAGGTLVYLGPQASGDPNNDLGYPVWESGTHAGYAAGLLMGNGGTVYSVSAEGSWYQWTETGWVQLAAAPNLAPATPTPTTSTVASPQSSTPTVVQVCTPAAAVTAATAPTVSSVSAASNTGLYVVGGGLALLALVWLMNQRRAS
jgi:hypothetical protein